MQFQIETDQVSLTEWSRLMALFEDANIYQTWAYGAVHWGSPNLSHLVVRRNGEVVGMAQLRIVGSPRWRCGIAYLRWGPMCQLRGRPLELESVRRLAMALHEEYARRRGLFLRILPNAFAGSDRAALLQHEFSQFNQAQPIPANAERTFLLDLTPPLEELRKKLDQKWRNQLNRAEKNALSLVTGKSIEEYRIFAQLYEKMWSRKKFRTTVDVHEFGRVGAALPAGQQLKIYICQYQGIPVSGIVCSALGNTGIYLLGATDDAGLNTKGSYLLQWSMIKWLKENGFQHYDLGGIDPELNPGVYHFKQGLSGQDVSRLPPFESCERFLSSVCMRAADLVRGGFRGFMTRSSQGILASVSEGRHTGTATIKSA